MICMSERPEMDLRMRMVMRTANNQNGSVSPQEMLLNGGGFAGGTDFNDNCKPVDDLNAATAKTKLPNGVDIPLLGLGSTHSSGYSHEAVVYALKDCNYRMIDTAKRYGVEKLLGIAIRDSGVAREDLFLISKLWPVDFGFASTKNACTTSCRNLGTDYLDLYLTHFPEVPDWFGKSPRRVREETWRALELLYERGNL